MALRRICITPQDIRILTGKSDKSARELYKKVRKYFCKKDHQFVTFREFCRYAGIPFKDLDDLNPL